MPASITPASAARIQDFLRCNQHLTQHLDQAQAWTLCGLRWGIQRFHYCCPVEPDYSVTPHQHEYLEVNLLCQGQLDFGTPDHRIILRPGDVCFMPPKRTHDWFTCKSPVAIAGFHIRISTLDETGRILLQALNQQVDAGRFRVRKNTEHSRIHRTIWRLIHEDPPGPLIADKINTWIQLFMQTLLERMALPALITPPVRPPAIGPETIAISKYQQIVDFIDRHINQPIQLEDIARHFNYSVRHVARLFRRESGVALGQYILERKLRAAQRLLATTDYPVKTIALDLGYHDVGYFCRLFRTHMMGTPNGYRTSMLVGRTASPDSPLGHHKFRGYFRGNGQPAAEPARR